MTNSHLQDLIRRIDARYNIDSASMSLGDWICANTHLRGRPFNFERYPFQKAIADDQHPNMDVIKPSQVGLSEVQIRKALAFLARNRGTTLIFTMPNEKMFKRMSTTRIKPLVEEEKAFNLDTRGGEKPTRNTGLYQIGSSFMFVTGATEGDATSISADVVLNDEVDLTDQAMLALFNSRLQNSDWKISQRFSTPTFSHFGVDKGYSISDQHVYMCRCLACNHWNDPTFRLQFVNIPGLPEDLSSLTEIDEQMIDNGQIDLVNAYVKCEKCHAPLPLGDPSVREWVPKYPSRDHHRGYRVSPFSTDRLSIQYIISQLLRYKSRDYLRGWHNTVLGEAYTDGNSRLSDSDIKKCFTAKMSVPEVDASIPTWLGIDMGQTCHVITAQGNTLQDLHLIEFDEVPIRELNEYVQIRLERYNVVGGACDRFPYTPNADDLFELSTGRIVPIEYRGQKPVNIIKDSVTQEMTHVQMNRTALLDQVARGVRRGWMRFSGYKGQKMLIVEHLKDMVRDEHPEQEARWIKLTGNDHYFHAAAFLIGGVLLKEVETAMVSDPRSSVSLIGASVGVATGNLIGGKQNTNSGALV